MTKPITIWCWCNARYWNKNDANQPHNNGPNFSCWNWRTYLKGKRPLRFVSKVKFVFTFLQVQCPIENQINRPFSSSKHCHFHIEPHFETEAWSHLEMALWYCFPCQKKVMHLSVAILEEYPWGNTRALCSICQLCLLILSPGWGIGLLLYFRSRISGGRCAGFVAPLPFCRWSGKRVPFLSAKGLGMFSWWTHSGKMETEKMFLLYSVPFSWPSFAYKVTIFFKRKLWFLL